VIKAQMGKISLQAQFPQDYPINSSMHSPGPSATRVLNTNMVTNVGQVTVGGQLGGVMEGFGAKQKA
jgi:hypothetical protein